MASLDIEWGGQRRRFDGPGPVTVGRDPSSDVTCDDSSVSRAHGRFEQVGGTWSYVDFGSKRGSYVGGQIVTRTPIEHRTILHVGELAGGVDLNVTLAVSVLDPTAPPPPAPPPAGGGWNPAPQQQPTPPPPGPGPGAPVPTGDQVIRLRVGNDQHTFGPPGPVVIGRDAGATVPVDNPLLSRAHARLTHDGQGWTIEDLNSKRGMWVDGEQVPRARLSGTCTVWLGPPDAGEKVVVVAPGETKKPRKSRTWIWPVAAAAAVIVVIIGALAVIQGNDGGGGTGENNLAALKAGTVSLTHDSEDGVMQGTGTVIDPRGLILTNAHVAVPSAPGQAVMYNDPATPANPDYQIVALTGADDEPAKPAYRARPVVWDGWLDLAVLEIYADAEGNPIDRNDLDLDAVPLGDSDEVKTGDALRVLGFPVASETEAITVTSGVVAGFGPDDRLDDPRGWMNSDAAIRGGNSGGLAADSEGRIIGIPTQGTFDKEDGETNDRARPINLAKPLIEAAQNGTPYDEYTSIEQVPAGTSMEAAGWGTASEEGCNSEAYIYLEGTTAVKPQFTFTGMVPGTDAMLALVPANAESLADGTIQPLSWTTDEDPESGCYGWVVELDSPLPAGAEIKAVALLGPSLQPVAEQTITISAGE